MPVDAPNDGRQEHGQLLLVGAVQDVFQVPVTVEDHVVGQSIHLQQPPLIDDCFEVQLKFGPDALKPLHLILNSSEPTSTA